MRFRVAFAVIVLMLICGIGQSDQIWEQPWYTPSSDLVLGNWGAEYFGSGGYVIDADFQVNLLYQSGILDADIEAFDTYDVPSDPNWTLNFSDNEEYVFNFVMPGGSLPVYEYGTGDTGMTAEWTLTGWGQTIFAGTMEYEAADGSIVDPEAGPWASIFFRVDPTQGYRSFPNDPPVNDVEAFGGVVLSEVVGYRYFVNSPAYPMDPGAVLEVELAPVPEPASMALLGLGLGGLVVARRRRRVS